MNCNTTHYRANSSSVPGDPTPSLRNIIRVAREAALGLAAAHKLGLVHRDIKPANLWLEAPNGRVKVLDFGLARPVGADAELTRSGAVVGTPAFMSPEQGRGQRVDHRTDLFSLGAVLYRLCTGKQPFPGPNVMAVLMALGTEEPAPVRELNPNIPEPLAALIHQLLAKNPDHRPQTAAEVAARLRAILDQLPTADSPAPPAAAAGDSHPPPVVVHPVPMQPAIAPMHITAPPESAFALLGEDDAGGATEVGCTTRGPKPARASSGGKGVWVGAALAVLVAVVAAGVIIIKIKNKDGSETEIKVPDGAAVEVTKDGKTIVKVDAKGASDPRQKPGPKVVAGAWASLSPSEPGADWSKLWEAQGAQDWRLQDGELFNSNFNRGWIGTKAEYGDFEIELEYKLGPKGNSGIFLRAWPGGGVGGLSGGQFVEIQLVDDDSAKVTAINGTGSVYKLVAPDPRPVTRLREWNTARVTAVGNRVAVTINGTKCVDADVNFPRAKGVIGLQQLDSPVYFRNVRVRELSAAAR